MTEQLTHVFCIELDRDEAKRRRTQPRSKMNPNPLSAGEFDELLWAAHERYVERCVRPLGERVITLPSPSDEAMVRANVDRILAHVGL